MADRGEVTGASGSTPVTRAILGRRSVRGGFRPDPVPTAVLREVVACGLAAPASKTAYPWRFHVVVDEEVLGRCADAAESASGAATWVPRDPRTARPSPRWESTVAESSQILRCASAAIFVENTSPFAGGREVVASLDGEVLEGVLFGYGLELAGIGAAIENLILSADALGLSGTFMGDPLVAENFIKHLLGVEGDLVGVLALGYSDERVPPRDHWAGVDDPERVVWHEQSGQRRSSRSAGMAEHQSIERPREFLDEIWDRRFKQDTAGVLDIGERAWSSWMAGEVTEPIGLGALLQVVYTATIQADDPSAQLWWARALSLSARNHELNTLAMLLLAPMTKSVALALEARFVGDTAAEEGFFAAALGIMDEVAALASAHAEAVPAVGGPPPGTPVPVLERAVSEKRGYVLWRARRYEESLECYERAAASAPEGTRDRVRVEAGSFLAGLGLEFGSAAVDRAIVRPRLHSLQAEALAGSWNDVASRLAKSLEVLERREEVFVQDLVPLELE